jgi:nitroreductase
VTDLGLTADELLRTTRSVRRRLDLERPVEPDLIAECVEVAQQAPTGSNMQAWHFLAVTDPATRAEPAALYQEAWEVYAPSPFSAANAYQGADPDRRQAQRRVVSSGQYLAENLARVPVHVIPCIEGRVDGQPSFLQAALWGSVLPAAWSFMLAARQRGLGSCLTMLHLLFEERAAHTQSIPYAQITQAALIPVAYTHGTDFKPANREPAGMWLSQRAIRCLRTVPHCRRIARFVSSLSITNVTASWRPISSASR